MVVRRGTASAADHNSYQSGLLLSSLLSLPHQDPSHLSSIIHIE